MVSVYQFLPISCTFHFSIDLLTKELNLTFTVKIVSDNEYGSYRDGKRNGMVGELLDDVVDIAVGPLTITYDREKVVYFTKV